MDPDLQVVVIRLDIPPADLRTLGPVSSISTDEA
jgi:hypothetical protein